MRVEAKARRLEAHPRHQIVARNTLPNASSATVQIEWLHMVGMEDAGTCF